MNLVIDNILLSGYVREHEHDHCTQIPNLVRKNIDLYMKQYSLHSIGHLNYAAESLAQYVQHSTMKELYRADPDIFCIQNNPKLVCSTSASDASDTCLVQSPWNALDFGPILGSNLESGQRPGAKLDPFGDSIHTLSFQLNGTLLHDKIVDIKMGHQHSLFLTVYGHVYAMGSNDSGQCGVGEDIQFIKSPKRITFDHISGNISNEFNLKDSNHLTISAIACGKLHSLFLDDTGRLLVCGYKLSVLTLY